MSGKVVGLLPPAEGTLGSGIVVPPPDIRTIVEKTAQFVARNGANFEARIRVFEAKNAKFKFLQESNPYHNYYRYKISEFQEGKDAEEEKKKTETEDVAPEEPTTGTVLEAKPAEKKAEIRKRIKFPFPLEKDLEEPDDSVFSRIPPPAYIAMLDIDVMKLTAQFIARHGKSFFAGIASREHRNPQFDFLRPSHHAHAYFQSLVEVYKECLHPSEKAIRILGGSKQDIMKRCAHMAEWMRRLDLKKQEQDEADEERVAMSNIDWHDFVVVGTIDFDEADEVPLPQAAPQKPTVKEVVEEEEEMPEEAEMDVDEDMEMELDEEKKPPVPSEDRPPLPPEPTDLKIVKDYQPKARAVSVGKQFAICPQCGQSIPVDELDEHMRIELLDPKWREQKQIAAEKQRQSLLEPSEKIGEHLKALAERRSDIFGEKTVEIGKKADGKEEETAPSVQWDGHKGSIPAVRAQARAIQSEKQNQPSAPAPKAPSGPVAGPSLPPPMPPMMYPPNMGMGGPMGGPLPPAFTMPPPNVSGQPMMPFRPPIVMPPTGPPSIAPPVPAPVMPSVPPPPSQPMPPSQAEPSAKRQKVESHLKSEDEWLALHPGQITVRVQIPNDPTKEQFHFNGQMEDVTVMDGHATLKAIKELLQAKLDLAPNRQKLKLLDGTVPKDSNTLAFYNLMNGAVLQLSLKERGGRK